MSGTSQHGRGPRGRGGRGGRGQGAGRNNAPPPHHQPSPPPSLSHSFEHTLTLEPRPSVWARPPASSSAPPPPSQGGVAVENIAAQPLPPPPSSTKAVTAPVRPAYGRAGRRCVVRANHFLVQVADRDLHHYDVSISPEVTSKRVCRDIIAELVKEYRDTLLQRKMMAYDGSKSAYCAGPLPFTSKEFVITLPEKDGLAREKKREFKVSIKFAAKADLHHLQQFLASRQLDAPQETIQALDVVLRAKPSSCYETVGRSFFSPNLGQAGELGNGLEYWKGFYQSLRPTQMGLSLNIDMSARAFYEPILVTEFVSKFLNKDPKRPLSLSDQDRLKVKKVLKGLKVQVNHQGHIRRYKVSGLSALPLARLTFPVDESGTMTTVVDYFREKYNVVLRHTSLPSILAGSEAKPAMLPMEICSIVEGQRYTRKLNERQVTELLRATCQRPEARERSIQDMVKKNNYNGDELVNKEFGIQVSPQPTTIEARVLPAPMLKYHESGRESRVDPRVGQWNMIGKKMVNGARVESWTCVCFSRSNFDLARFCWELVDMCCSKGMDFNPDPLIPIKSVNPGQIEKALHDIQSQSAAKLDGNKQLQLLIIVLPDVSGSYGKIKRICETELGIVSQCCQPRQASKCNKQYLENVALKINVKTGGRNTVLEQAIQRKIPFLTDQRTIVFGADVTHPAPGEDSSPSIAAVVGSMDWPEVTKYRGLVSAQPHRQEIIFDLFNEHGDPARGIARGGMIRELLLAFYKCNMQQKPTRIIFYRDGVSEGQFSQVLLEEVDAIRRACVSLEENYLPRVTFIVVQKRHHTRLFPEKHGDRNTTDKSGNILPGTVVDTRICHPTEFDFYLSSHAGIQGTSRPAHYHVLYDENMFSADALQLLTNNLCYTYARCTRSVSIVPPAYYAHLAAFRARYYIEGEFSESGSSHAGSSGRATRENTTPVRPLPLIKDNVKDVMFYC